MYAFFSNWRRKVGVVTLLLACVLTVWWVRSLGTADFITWVGRYGLLALNSENGLVELNRQVLVSGRLERGFPKRNSWDSLNLTLPDGTRELIESYVDDLRHCENKSEFLGLISANGSHDGGSGRLKILVIVIPYRNLVLPLTLLSAYLILWNPRKRPSPDVPVNTL